MGYATDGLQRAALLLCVAAVACSAPEPLDSSGPVAGWPEHGGEGARHYSPLTQITPDNVHALEVAWTYRHGDVSQGTADVARTSFQVNPIVVGDKRPHNV